MTAVDNGCLSAALRFAELGYRVFPCVPNSKVPFEGSGGCNDATADAGTIIRWWEDNPTANLAISTDGLIVIDVDGGNWLGSDEGQRATEAAGGVAGTPRGGTHLVFRDALRNLKCSTSEFQPKIDTRGMGGYIVAAPSRVDGRWYRWRDGRELPPLDELPEVPDWLRAKLPIVGKQAKRRAGAGAGTRISEGGRNNRLASLAGAMRRVGADLDTIVAALKAENESRFDPPLDDAEVVKVAKSVCGYKPERQATIAGSTSTGGPLEGWEIIRDYFKARYAPGFKIGDSIYSGSELRDVRRIEACAALPPDLIAKLGTAANWPKYADGTPKGTDAAPGFFKKWAGTGWGGLLADLPDEDAAELGTDAANLAAEEFRRLVREAMLTMIVVGQDVVVGLKESAHLETKLEKLPLAMWCKRFAQPGPWRDVRGYKCWCKTIPKGDGEVVYKIAFRHELFSQIKADRRLIEMGPNKFARRCERYGIGKPGGQNERPHGNWALVLDDGFVADLIGSADLEDSE